jgi:hypothetical protein
MPDRLKRASFARIAVGMAVLAFPLLAVGTAQAAIAGAPPESTSNRPDLVSVKVLDSTDADFCFDKTLNNAGFLGGNFALGGYRSARFIPATAAALEQTFDTSGKCVRAIFTAGNIGGFTLGDITQYTIGTVASGAVQTGAAITNPETDSAPLTFPASMTPTHNGTAGFTAGPDLTSVLVDPTTNTITYVEDQNIDTATTPVAADFTFTRSGGTQCNGNLFVAASANTVTIHFDLATCPVSDAQRAGTVAGAIPGGASADPGIPSTPSEVIVPASSTSSGTGTTSAPDLVGTQLTNNGSDLNFTFDKTVTVGTPAHFHAVLSISGSSALLNATSCSAINTTNTSTTVQCQFNGPPEMSQFSEYVVKGAVDAGAVTETSAPNIPNVTDALAAGDNAGAFARGFTTAADVLGGIINTTTGVLTLALDQRMFLDAPGNIHLVDGTGFDTTPAGASSVAFPIQAAGPEAVTVQFSPGQAVTAKNVSVRAGSLATFIGVTNVPQVLSITTTSSIVKHLKTAKHMSKRAAARSNARSRAKNRAIVRRLMRHA